MKVVQSLVLFGAVTITFLLVLLLLLPETALSQMSQQKAELETKPSKLEV